MITQSLMCLAAGLLLSATLGCKQAEFTGGDGLNLPVPGNSAEGLPTTQGSSPMIQTTETPQTGGGIVPTEDPILQECPPRDVQILVVDLRSGWWAGDGEEFFKTMLGNLTGRCNGRIRMEYHHILDSGFIESANYVGGQGGGSSATRELSMSVFGQRDFRAYTQIWLLSGSNTDDGDITTGNRFFGEMITAIVNSGADLLIGGGGGAVTHANALGARLGLGNLFATNKPALQAVEGDDAVAIATQIPVAGMTHPLFTGVGAAIADGVRFDGADEIVESDWIVAGGVQPLAMVSGRPVLGVLPAGNERRIVLDAGLQRYHAIRAAGGQPTVKFLQNIISYLE